MILPLLTVVPLGPAGPRLLRWAMADRDEDMADMIELRRRLRRIWDAADRRGDTRLKAECDAWCKVTENRLAAMIEAA